MPRTLHAVSLQPCKVDCDSAALQIFLRWVPAGAHPAPSGGDKHGAIQLQRSNRRSARGCAPLDQVSVDAPSKVLAPGLCARVVERHQLACLRVCRSDLPALLLVAGPARALQVLTRRRAVGDPRDDVLDAQRNAAQPLVGVAVAAEMTGIGKDLLLELNRDVRTAHEVGTGSSASVGS